jgi:response regulator of citrate/malate metabolism
MSEKPGYRDNLERINERFADHEMLTASEVAEFLGISHDTVRRRLKFNTVTKRISKADLARQISAG